MGLQCGGADADSVWAKLTVENNRDRQVRLDDLAVEVVKDEPTPGGSVAACPVGGASAEAFGLLVDLAQDPPGLQFRENPGEEWGPVPGFELDPGELDSFVIYVAGRPERLVCGGLWLMCTARANLTTRTTGRQEAFADGWDWWRTPVHLDGREVGALPPGGRLLSTRAAHSRHRQDRRRAHGVLCISALDAELLVLGSHGHGAVHDQLVGSTSMRAIHHASCPVVVLPDPRHAKRALKHAKGKRRGVEPPHVAPMF